MDKTGRLSACMMVKDEEQFLPRCLESIKGLVDEIVVVDTGSTDRSVEIAESFGARVYHHPWENNFSIHRNQSMDYATGDWVFIIDADEVLNYMPGMNHEKFRKWIFSMPESSDAGAIGLHDIQQGTVVMRMNTARVFRKGKVKYDGAVHNQPIIKKRGFLCSGVYLDHYGYDLSPEKMDAKEKRTKGLLLKRIENDPKDYLAYFYLSQMCATRGDSKGCVEYGEKYFEHREELAESFNQSIFYTVLNNYIKLQDFPNAERWLYFGLKELPDDLDMNFALILYGIHMKDPDKIMVGGRQYLKTFDTINHDPACIQGRFTYSFSLEALSHVLYNMIILNIDEGFKLLKTMEQPLGQIPDHMRKDLVRGLKETFIKYGLELGVSEPGGKEGTSVQGLNEDLVRQIKEGMVHPASA